MVQVIFKSRVPVLMILCLSQGDATTVVPGTNGSAVDLDLSLALETKKNLDLTIVAVLLDEATRWNHLDAHCDPVGTAI